VSQGNQHSTPVQQQQQQQQAGQPVEFNHAINYVNKIKVKICHRHGDAQQQAGQPVKFNHAINYVNKISKNCHRHGETHLCRLHANPLAQSRDK
jgi:histone deacetylase complex regulatory component SIN3